MSAALERLKVRGVELANRIVVPPMCTWMSDPMNNEPNDRHLVHYGGFAVGGSGLIIFEVSAVEYRGRVQPEDLGIYDDRCVALLKPINDYIHENSISKTAMQIGHAGRKGTCLNSLVRNPVHLKPEDLYGSQHIGPSEIAYDEGYYVPKVMTDTDLNEVKLMFVAAARRCVRAGFDAIEVHCAHGYLLSSFTSPSSNQRTDQYGGCLENRLRYPLEVIKAVRDVIPESMPLLVRYSANEWTEGGFSPRDAVIFAKKLKAIGVDLLHISSGGLNAAEQIPHQRQFQIPLAHKIKDEANIQVIAVGHIDDLTDAANIIQDGKADLVAVGRSHLQDPYWFRNQIRKLNLQYPYAAPMYQTTINHRRQRFLALHRKAQQDHQKPTD